MTNKKRYKPDVRKQQIVDAGLELAAQSGIDSLTRDAIAERVGVSGAAVQYHFATIKQLRRAIKRAAVADPWANLPTIARLVVAEDPAVDSLNTETRCAAIEGFR